MIKSGLAFLFYAVIAITMVNCQNEKIISNTKDLEPEQIAESLKLVDYGIHYVALSHPYTRTDSTGEKKQYETAWLVLFNLENLPKTFGPRIDFMLGNYSIPEYGSWSGGIYFRFYEQTTMEEIEGQEIYYQYQGSKPISLDRRFETSKFKDLPTEKENDVLGREK